MNNQKGFTLVEVIVVIAIIGILSAITAPKISAFTVRNKEKQRIEHKMIIDKAIRQCYAIEGKLPENIEYIKQNKYAFIDTEKYIYTYSCDNDKHTYNLEIQYKK